MPGDPGNALKAEPANPLFVTSDSFGGEIILGCERRYTIPEKFSLTGAGDVPSTLIVPAGVRLLITGLSYSWALPVAALIQARLEATLAGSGLLTTPDQPLGTYTPITENLNLAVGVAPSMIPSAHPTPLNVVTAEGDGFNPVFQMHSIALLPPDVLEATVYYSPIYGEKPGC